MYGKNNSNSLFYGLKNLAKALFLYPPVKKGQVIKLANLLAVCGAGPLNVGGVIPSLLSCSSKRVILFTGSNKFDHKARDVFVNGKKKYSLCPITKELLLKQNNLEPDVVLYCERDNPMYRKIIETEDIVICACRDGLKTYADDVEMIVKNTKDVDIISLDNNAAFIKDAAARSEYSNIHYTHAVVHGAVVSMCIEKDKIIVNAGEPAEITLPPVIKGEKILLKKKPPHRLWQPKEPTIKIAKNDAEFQLKIDDKKTTINAQHSIQVVAALSKGVALGYSIEETQEKPFKACMSFDEMISISSKAHMIMYAHMIEKLQKLDGYQELEEDLLDYKGHYKSMWCFLKFTYDSEDLIKRGININKPMDAKYKYESHIGALRETVIYYNSDERIRRAVKILSHLGHEISDDDFRTALYVCQEIVTAADELFGNK